MALLQLEIAARLNQDYEGLELYTLEIILNRPTRKLYSQHEIEDSEAGDCPMARNELTSGVSPAS